MLRRQTRDAREPREQAETDQESLTESPQACVARRGGRAVWASLADGGWGDWRWGRGLAGVVGCVRDEVVVVVCKGAGARARAA